MSAIYARNSDATHTVLCLNTAEGHEHTLDCGLVICRWTDNGWTNVTKTPQDSNVGSVPSWWLHEVPVEPEVDLEPGDRLTRLLDGGVFIYLGPVDCDGCGGSGRDASYTGSDGAQDTTCAVCEGTGDRYAVWHPDGVPDHVFPSFLRHVVMVERRGMARTADRPCDNCDGRGSSTPPYNSREPRRSMRVEQCPDCDGTGTIPGHDWQPREGLLAEMTVADWQRHVDAQGEHDCSYRRTLAVTPTIPDEPSVEQVEALMRKRGVTGLGQASTFTWSRRIFQQVLDVLREGPTDG